MKLPSELRRHIPSVTSLLKQPALVEAIKHCPRWAIVDEARLLVEQIREGEVALVHQASEVEAWRKELGTLIASRAERRAMYSLRHVINGTGVVLHTNMGRALLAESAIEHMNMVARNYSNLELDLESGERGSRYSHVSELLCELTGAEDAIVVNNNAAAVVLTLSELAKGKEVVIARGELVEIGGSFRIPEIMEVSGCSLKEIGSTNRVHLSQYEEAIGEETALLLKVHTSNYRVIGFTKTVEVSELVPVAKAKGILIMNDLGSGSLVDLRRFGLAHEPTVQEAIAEGADVVTFSGDKLLGGPQIGVIAGRAEVIARLRRNQFLRALRVDKLTLAALEATLRIYRDNKDPALDIPGLRMLNLSAEELKIRAESFAAKLQSCCDGIKDLRLLPGESLVGAGSAPEAGLPTHLVSFRPKLAAVEIDTKLRKMTPAVMIRIVDGDIVIDLRTVAPREETQLIECLTMAMSV